MSRPKFCLQAPFSIESISSFFPGLPPGLVVSSAAANMLASIPTVSSSAAAFVAAQQLGRLPGPPLSHHDIAAKKEDDLLHSHKPGMNVPHGPTSDDRHVSRCQLSTYFVILIVDTNCISL